MGRLLFFRGRFRPLMFRLLVRLFLSPAPSLLLFFCSSFTYLTLPLPSPPSFSLLHTVTVVQDATHVSQHAVISATDGSFNVDVQCGLDGLSATCTEQVSEGTQATTQIISGTYSPVAVPVVTGSDTFPASSLTVSASASGASITFSSTGSGSGTGSLSVLPAQITVTSRTSSASATVTSGLSESGTSTSGAERVFGAGAGAGAGLMIAGLGMLFSTMFVL